MPDHPSPPVSADLDVRHLDSFMLNVDKLMASELWALATGEEFKAAVGLWCRAWRQVPAGSLPDNERMLASFADVAPARWRKVREVAMRGFVLCSDGRLYHPLLCADAVRAKAASDAQRKRAQAGANGRWNKSKSNASSMPQASPEQSMGMPRERESDGAVISDPSGQRENARTPDDGLSAHHSEQPPSASDPASRWPFERAQPWAALLIAAGCKIGSKNWLRWKALADEHGAERVATVAKSIPAQNRWDDATEAALTAAHGQTPLSQKVRSKIIHIPPE